ncbi:MAG: hypothetical protein KJO00_13090, partial [Bacteroidia bacterium]|nr:hypothetical protein [Bacteroidia bacterium]
MPIFKGQNNNYLLTNFKVMYSTLSHADSLEPVKLDRRLKRDMLLSKLKLRSDKFYFICRNPYRRLESFFREKFRNKVDYFERNGYWQDGQKLFFPYLHIDESFTPEDIKQKLLDTSFSKLITILPEVYLKDRHLRPQWLRLRVSFTKWGIPFRFKVPLVQILKIESMEELDFLNQIF